MTLLELGAKLRGAREDRGLSVEDVAAALKISIKVLRALEAGDEEHLPQAAFVRNFIRAYGRYLGFSDEEMQEDAAAVLGAADFPVKPSFAVESGARPQIPVRQVMLLGGLGLLVALLLAGGYAFYANWGMIQESISRVLQESPLQSGVQEPLLPPEQPAPAQEVEQTQTPAPAVEQPAAAPEQPAGEAEAPAAAPAAAQVDKLSDNRLVVTGIARCWIRYKADGEKAIDHMLQKGGTLALSFKDRLEVQFGNVGGVRLTYNGRDLPPVSKAGNYTMVFPESER